MNSSSQGLVDAGDSSVEFSYPKQPAQFESVRSTYRWHPLERQIRHPHLSITHRQYSSDRFRMQVSRSTEFPTPAGLGSWIPKPPENHQEQSALSIIGAKIFESGMGSEMIPDS